jgi:hypothetical protein
MSLSRFDKYMYAEGKFTKMRLISKINFKDKHVHISHINIENINM